MKISKFLRASVASVAITTALAPVFYTPSAHAQSTVSSIRGVITDTSGSPLSGAIVTITDTRNGSSQTVTTGGNGSYSARNLGVGGPYTVAVSRNGFQSERLEGIFINLSGATTANIDLETAGAGGGDEIVVTATRANTQQLAIGPSSVFGQAQLEALPSISRDIRDTIRLDPRLTVTGGDDQVSCLGGNSRATSFTIDGVASSDAFGLNASGTPARANFPLPFDAIQETAVEFAPYDVTYGNFTTCNINIVTKAGTNEFHGSAFAVFNSRSLTGSEIDGITALGDDSFRDFNWGASVSGPIIKDKLFLAVSYEQIRDGGSIIGFGPEDGPFTNGVPGFLTEDVAPIESALAAAGFETGGLASVVPETSRRISTRLDWLINDDHRFEFNYSRERELEVEPDLFGVSFQFLNSFENSGSSNERYSARLFSSWTDNFSTEIRLSRTDNQDIQNPVGGGEAQDANPIPRIIINGITDADGTIREFAPGGFGDGIQGAGPGFFRSANELVTQTDQLRVKGDYVYGNHLFTAGYELNSLDVFNLFAVNATGTIEFDTLETFVQGIATNIDFTGTASGDINDAAAEFSRNIHTLYVQDTWTPTDALTVSLGLRYDFYQSGDQPTASPLFEQRFGFSNDTGFNDFQVFLPRLGINYDAGPTIFGETTFRAGAGVFSGGDPTVFFSNAFTNNGFGTASADENNAECNADPNTLTNLQATGFAIPQCILNEIQADAAAGNGRTDAIDPNLDIPSVVRGSIGLTHFTDFGGAFGGLLDDWQVSLDAIYTANRNSLEFIDLTLSPTAGIAPDGRPLFEAIDPLLDGCNATFLGPRLGFANTAGCSTFRDQDILLTNVVGDNGRSISISAQFAKTFDYTLFNNPASWNLNLGYAYTNATAVATNLSSTATSSFEEVATISPNFNQVAPAQFVNPHVISLASTFRQELFQDLPTSFSFFVQARQGRPFSFVFDADTSEDIFGDSDDEARTLLTVPTGPNDPNFDFSALNAEQQFAFFNTLSDLGLSGFGGGFAPRNQFNDPWFVDLDFRFQQDLPDFIDGLRTIFFVDVENALNLFGANSLRTFDRGNTLEGVPVFGIVGTNPEGQFVVGNNGLSDLSVDANGVITFEDSSGNVQVLEPFNPQGLGFGALEPQITGGDGFDRNADGSLWSVQFGLRFEF